MLWWVLPQLIQRHDSSVQGMQDGLHMLELFGGVGMGVLRTTLAAGYSVRCYTYVDKDPISKKIERATLQSLQQQYLDLKKNPKKNPKCVVVFNINFETTDCTQWSSGHVGWQMGVPEC